MIKIRIMLLNGAIATFVLVPLLFPGTDKNVSCGFQISEPIY